MASNDKNIFQFNAQLTFQGVDAELQAIKSKAEEIFSAGDKINIDLSLNNEAEFFKKIDTIKSLKDLDLSNIREDMEGLQFGNVNTENMNALASALKTLRESINATFAQNIGTVGTNLTTLANGVKLFDSISNEPAIIEALGKALASLNSNLNTTGNIKKIPTVIEQLNSADFKSFDEDAQEFAKGLDIIDKALNGVNLDADKIATLNDMRLNKSNGIGKLAQTIGTDDFEQAAVKMDNAVVSMEGSLNRLISILEKLKVVAAGSADGMKGPMADAARYISDTLKILESNPILDKIMPRSQVQEFMSSIGTISQNINSLGSQSLSSSEDLTSFSKGLGDIEKAIQTASTELGSMQQANKNVDYTAMAEQVQRLKNEYDSLADSINKQQGTGFSLFGTSDADAARENLTVVQEAQKTINELKANELKSDGEKIQAGQQLLDLQNQLKAVVADNSIMNAENAKQAQALLDVMNGADFSSMQEMYAVLEKQIYQWAANTEGAEGYLSAVKQLNLTASDVNKLTSEYRKLNETSALATQELNKLGDAKGAEQLKVQLENIVQSSSSAAQRIKEFLNNTEKLNSSLINNAKNAEQVSSILGKVDFSKLNAAQAEAALRELVAAYSGTSAGIESFKITTDSASHTILTMAQSIATANGEVRKIKLEFDAADGSVRSLEDGVKTMDNAVEGATNSSKGLARGISLASIEMKILFETVQQFKDAVKYIADMDKIVVDMAMVTGQKVNQLDDDLARMRGHAEALHATYKDTYDASLTLFKQGLDMSEADQRMQTAIKLAQTGSITMNESIQAITVGVNSMQESAEKTADVLLLTGNITDTSVEGLARAFQDTAASAYSLNWDIEQLASTLATLTEVTQQSESRVGTGLKSMLARFNNITFEKLDSDELNKVEAVFQNIAGIDFRDANGQIRSMYDLMRELSEVWDTLGQNEKMSIATEAAGARMQTYFYAMVENFDQIEERTNNLATAAGSVDRAYEEWSTSVQAHLNDFKRAWEEMVMSVGSSELLKTFLDLGTFLLKATKEVGPLRVALFTLFTVADLKAQDLQISIGKIGTEAQVAGAKGKGGLKDLGDGAKNAKVEVDKAKNAMEQLAQHRENLEKGIIRFNGLSAYFKAAQTEAVGLKGIITMLQADLASLGALAKSIIGSMLKSTLITAAISAATYGLQKVWEWLNRSKVEAQELKEAFNNLDTSQLSSQLSGQTLVDAEELDRLEKRRTLIGLNEEEQQKYNEILQKLQRLFPDLKTVQDEYGNSVLDTTSHLNGAVDAVRELQKALAYETWQATLKGADEALKEIDEKITSSITGSNRWFGNKGNIIVYSKEIKEVLNSVTDGIENLPLETKLEIAFMLDRPSFDRAIEEISDTPEKAAQAFAEKEKSLTDRIQAGLKSGLYEMGVTLPAELEQVLFNSEMLQALAVNFTKAGAQSGEKFNEALTGVLSNISKFNTGGAFSGILAELEKIDNLRKQVEDGNIEADVAAQKIAEIYAQIGGEFARMLELQDEYVAKEHEKAEATNAATEAIQYQRLSQEDATAALQKNIEGTFALKEELITLDEAYREAYAAHQAGLEMSSEAMDAIIQQFPELAQYYGDTEGMMVGLSEAHGALTQDYLTNLTTMVLGQDLANNLQVDGMQNLVNLLRTGMNKNLEDDAEWASFKSQTTAEVIADLAGRWAEYYKVQANGTITLNKAGQHARDQLAKTVEAAAAQDRVLNKMTNEHNAAMAASGLEEYKRPIRSDSYTEALAELKEFDARTQKLNDIAKETYNNLDKMRKTISGGGDFAKAINSPLGGLNSLGDAAGRAKAAMDKFNKSAGNTGPTKDSTKAKDANKKATNSLKKAEEDNKKAVDELKDANKALSDELKKVKDEAKNVEDQMKDLENQYKDYISAIEKVEAEYIKRFKAEQEERTNILQEQQEKERQLLEKGTVGISNAIINPDNVESNMAIIAEKYDQLMKEIGRKREDEDKRISKMYEERLTRLQTERDAAVRAIQDQIDAINKLSDAEEYRRNLQDKTKEVGKITQQIADYSLDDSLAAQAKKKKLEEDLTKAKLDLASVIRDREKQSILETLRFRIDTTNLDYDNKQAKLEEQIEQEQLANSRILEDRRTKEDKLLEEQRQKEEQAQEYRLALQKQEHDKQMADLDAEYTQRKNYERAMKAIKDGYYTTYKGQIVSTQSMLMQNFREFENAWGILAHKREEEAMSFANKTRAAVKQFGVDVHGHVIGWKVEMNSTYQFLSQKLDGLNQQQANLTKQQEAINQKINDLQKVQEGLRQKQNTLNNAIKSGSNYAKGLNTQMNNAVNYAKEYNKALRRQRELMEENTRRTEREIAAQKRLAEAKAKVAKSKALGDNIYWTEQDGPVLYSGPDRFNVRAYSDGGKIDYTGPALVHGTKRNPEYVFNTPQMKALAQMIKQTPGKLGVGAGASGSVFNVESFLTVQGDADQTTVANLKSISKEVFNQIENYFKSKGIK